MAEEPSKAPPASGEPSSANAEPPQASETSITLDAALIPVAQTLEKQGVPEETKATILSQVEMAIRHYSGPLPSPEMLKGYAEACEGGAERIMAAFEREAAHRQRMELDSHSLEREVVQANIKFVANEQSLASRGQVIAAALALFFGISGLVLGLKGHDVLAGTLVTSTIGAILTAFVIGHQSKKKDRENASQENDSSRSADQDDSARRRLEQETEE
jgi:uncharacterized membrane protein